MKRLLAVSIAVGVIGAAVVAWEAREGVAYAVEQPASDPQHELLRAAVAGCADAGGLATTRIQAGIYVSECRANLGLGPAVKRAR